MLPLVIQVPLHQTTAPHGAPRHAFLVLGMHRSGTSAVTGVLGHLGLSLPSELMRPNVDNPHGYFETWELARLHNAILRSAGTRWDDWSPIAQSWFSSPAGAGYVAQINRYLEREFASASAFVIKDPRICRLVPIWREALERSNAKPLIILPLRHPDVVAQSLMRRNGILPAESNLLWLRYALDAERATRDLPRVFAVFDELLDDWRAAVEGVARRLGVRWPIAPAEAAGAIESFLDRKLVHHRPGNDAPAGDGPAGELAIAAWHLFNEFARGEESTFLHERFDRLTDQLDRMPPPRQLPFGLEAISSPLARRLRRLR